MKFTIVMLLLVACVMLVITRMNSTSSESEALLKDKKLLEDKLNVLIKSNAYMREKIESLKTNDFELEKLARDKHGMSKSNEIIFIVN